MVSKLAIRGFPVTRMDCMVPRRLLGKPVSPNPLLKTWFPRLFPVSGIWGEVPLAPCGSGSWSVGPQVGKGSSRCSLLDRPALAPILWHWQRAKSWRPARRQRGNGSSLTPSSAPIGTHQGEPPGLPLGSFVGPGPKIGTHFGPWAQKGTWG